METRKYKIEEIVKKLCNTIMALCVIYATIYVVLFALCKDESVISRISTVIFNIAICTCLWAYIMRQFVIEISVFYSAIKEKDATWIKISTIRFAIMMLLCSFFCWVNIKIYDKLF